MSPLVLACASMDADAWTNTLYLAKRVLSAATSTSMIRPLAASILVLVVDILSEANRSLDIDAPLSALKVAIFSSAWVKTPTDMSSKSIAPLIFSAAKE